MVTTVNVMCYIYLTLQFNASVTTAPLTDEAGLEVIFYKAINIFNNGTRESKCFCIFYSSNKCFNASCEHKPKIFPTAKNQRDKYRK